MKVALGLGLTVVGVLAIVGRRWIGPPPSVGAPKPGTKAFSRWTSYNRGLGVLVGVALIVIGLIYAFAG